jgi:AcrR family transcriptional regulator
MRAKPAERRLARRLRAESGMPMKQIAGRLNVSPASVHLWTKDIEITPDQRSRNMKRAGATRGEAWRERHRERRRLYQLEGRARAREGDPLHMAGCMLHWAEGTKERNVVRFCNSDAHMIRVFRDFLVQCFEVKRNDLRFCLHVYLGNGLSVAEIERFWLNALDLPRSCIRGHSINPLPTSSSGKKKHKLPYGVCTLSLGNTRIVQHIYGAIQEYGGFEEAGWLDGPDYETRPSRRKRGAPDKSEE